jgi:hypothetical protein
VGLAACGISADLIEPGRTARVIGIVKRAHPSASDQRFAIAPRSSDDLQLGEASMLGSDDSAVQPGDAGDLRGVGGEDGRDALASARPATLASLGDLVDVRVRVGGRLADQQGRRLVLDDGTAAATIVLARGAAVYEPDLHIGEVLNVTGRVRQRPGGGVEVVVLSGADIARASAAVPSAAPAPAMTSALLSATLDGPVDETLAAREQPGGQGGPSRVVVGALAVMLALAAAALLGVAGLAVLRPHVLAGWFRRLGRGDGRSPRDPNGPADEGRIGPV